MVENWYPPSVVWFTHSFAPAWWVFIESCKLWTKEPINSISHIYICMSWPIQTVRYYDGCWSMHLQVTSHIKLSSIPMAQADSRPGRLLRCDLAYFLREDKFVDLGCPNGVLACGLAEMETGSVWMNFTSPINGGYFNCHNGWHDGYIYGQLLIIPTIGVQLWIQLLYATPETDLLLPVNHSFSYWSWLVIIEVNRVNMYIIYIQYICICTCIYIYTSTHTYISLVAWLWFGNRSRESRVDQLWLGSRAQGYFRSTMFLLI